MLFRNFTPFPPLYFESRDERQNDFGVVVLRGTFQLENGKPLRLQQEQEPILFRDEYFGDPQMSSLKFDSSMAPFKPKTDVLVNAHAFSPTWQAEKEWNTSVRFGDRVKTLTVTGPRAWERKMGVFVLTDAEPVDQVPLRYELAYGGAFIDADGKRQACPENPIGCGFVDPQNKSTVAAPQIFSNPEEARSLTYGRPCETAGLGPIAPHWAPRNTRVGTYNEMWKRTRFPDPPEDFDFHFYNSASTGMTLDGFASGDEEVELINLTPERKTTFQLPNLQIGSLMRFASGEILPGPVFLDTVHIDTFENRVYLTWRTVYPVDPPLRALEFRVKETEPDLPRPVHNVSKAPEFFDDDIYFAGNAS